MVISKSARPTTKQHNKRRVILAIVIIAGLLIAGTLSLYIFFKTNPYISAMLIRNSFEKGGTATNQIIEKYAPQYIPTVKNVSYRANDPDALLDVYYTLNNPTTAPTILWVHGGGWLAGNKDDLSPWARVLADKGFNVIALNYSIAPEKKYPLPVVQLNAALTYLNTSSEALHLDMDKLILGGDSAGAQIIAQASLIETNPEYAKKFGMSAGLTHHKIAGLLLNCGPYDLTLVDPKSTSAGARIVQTFLWSYTGKKDYMSYDRIEYASIPPYVTKDFPPSFITAGNVDPLLPHSLSLADALKKVNVATDTLFYPQDYTPALNHEYQFNLDTKEGKAALERMVQFAKKYTAKTTS